ncbi:hypothetical protein Tco_0296277 [Tanacetum coccineum]
MSLFNIKKKEDLIQKRQSSNPSLPPEGPLSQEEFDRQIKELKRISDLKAEKEKLEQELRKLLNPATLKAQAHKWTEHEAKKAKMMEEYNHQISYRADPLPITKISYVVNSRKEATMKITRGDNPLNLIVLDQNVEKDVKDVGFVAMEEVTFEQIMDEVDSNTHGAQENTASPYDTESEIKIIKSYQVATISGSLFIHRSSSYDQDKDAEEGDASGSLYGLRSIPDDDLASISGFEHTDSVDHLIKDSIKSCVSESILEELPQVKAHVQKNLHNQLPNILLKPMYKEFNAFNKLESQRFVLLQKELSKFLHNKMRKSIRHEDLQIMFKDMVSLLEAAEVFKKANDEGEKGITESGESHVSAQGMKRLSDLKAEKEKLEQELRKMFNQATLKAQAQKWTKHEVTKPLNLVVYPNFRLKMLGFNEWMEVHALASKKYGKSNDMLLQSLREKITMGHRPGMEAWISPPQHLANFGRIAEDKKRERTENLLHEWEYGDRLPKGKLSIEEPLSGGLREVMKRLSECKALERNIRRIRVKDIVKEVEDYLKTYSSAGMDISWYVEGIRCGSKAGNSISPKGATKGDLSCLYQVRS